MKFLCFKFKQNCITHICTKYHEDAMKEHICIVLISLLYQYCEKNSEMYKKTYTVSYSEVRTFLMLQNHISQEMSM